MKGLIIWSQSNCRSTMALYRELIRELNVPTLITLWHYQRCAEEKDIREKVGFSHDEFADLPIEPVGEDYEKGLGVIASHPGWHHLFCIWQGSPVYRWLITETKRHGNPVAVMCESPCNMSSGWRKMAKALYMRLILPCVARPVTRAADFFVNYSGDDPSAAQRIGWPKDKIIPFGYFSPPIVGSHCVLRKGNRPFEILATGLLAKYRGADLLVEALRMLKDRGVPYHATITQKGELYDALKERIKNLGLPIDMPGFVEMPKLISLYENCSVYVGAGRSEPWGMRLNDALQCGSPLIVSSGMGGRQLVDRYGCGVVFPAGDTTALANALEHMIKDEASYKDVAENAVVAASANAPAAKAKELVQLIKEWL